RDAPPRQTAYAERKIERQRAGGDDVDAELGMRVAEFHDRPAPVPLLDIGEGVLERLVLVAGHGSPGWSVLRHPCASCLVIRTNALLAAPSYGDRTHRSEERRVGKGCRFRLAW